MNERIKLLAEQAGATVMERSGWTDYGTLNLEVEKFAELIVAECIEKVRGEFLPVLEDEAMMKDTHWDGYVQCGVDSVVAIREHFFGVEE
jgi:hypothetical protein